MVLGLNHSLLLRQINTNNFILFLSDDQWDSLGDDCEFSHFTVKWKPLSPLRIPIESREVRHHLSEVLNSWKSLSEDSRTAYSRYMAIESNELEGVFKLTQQVSFEPPSLGRSSGC